MDNTTASTGEDPTYSPNAADSRQGLVVGMVAGFLTLATVAVALRVYVRARVLRIWGLEDSFLMVSYGLVVAIGSLELVQTAYGLGQHTWFLTPEQLVMQQKHLLPLITLYQTSTTVIKATFILQYRKAFAIPGFQKFCDIFLICIVVIGVAMIVTATVPCLPVSKLWDSAQDGSCMNPMIYWSINTAINFVTDLIILVMPLPIIRNLSIALLPKIILLMVFGLGLFTCAATIMRMITLIPPTLYADGSYSVALPDIWSIIEVSSAIVCICVPTLRPLLGSFGRVDFAGSRLSNNGDSEAGKSPRKNEKAPEMVTVALTELPVACLANQSAVLQKEQGTEVATDDGMDEYGVDEGEHGVKQAELPTPLHPPPPSRNDSMVVEIGPQQTQKQ